MGLKKYLLGRLTLQRGREGKALAQQFFKQKGFQIRYTGKNRGDRSGCDPYDFIVSSTDGKQIAANVKYAHSSLHIQPGNVKRLWNLGLPVVFLPITSDHEFYWAEIKRI
jgi:hypothetical protein